MEMLRSNYLDPAYPRHMHATFTIGIVDTGVVINQSRGATSAIPENCVYMFNPEEVHSGYAPTSTLISHRTFYPSEAALVELAQEMGFQGKPYFKSPSCFDTETVSIPRRFRSCGTYTVYSSILRVLWNVRALSWKPLDTCSGNICVFTSATADLETSHVL